MYSLIIDILIWSFAIYGFVSFIEEFFINTICYIILKTINIVKFCENIIAKKER